MKDNNKCPNCGSQMIAVYDKPTLNLTCPKCGCKIATTKWDEIDLDDTIYKIIIKPITNPKISQIKCISGITGYNFIKSKDVLLKGGLIKNCKALEVKSSVKKMEKENLNVEVNPKFLW